MQNIPNEIKLQAAVPEVQHIKYMDNGGSKAVYETTICGTKEALKVIYLPEEDDLPDARNEIAARVKREIESLRKLTCPYVVKLGSYGPKDVRVDGHEYMVYSEELLRGGTLAGQIRAHYRPSLSECVHLMECLIAVIKDLKANDLIHRDIKPANIIDTGDENRRYVVLDLGIAFKLHSSAITNDPSMRQGTLPFMAPEMFNPRFRELLDFRSDLYSAAVTVYQYAAGVHPIVRRGEDDYTTMYRIEKQKPVSLRDHRPDFPPRFCEIINDLMKKIPALRPSNLLAIQHEMEELQ